MPKQLQEMIEKVSETKENKLTANGILKWKYCQNLERCLAKLSKFRVSNYQLSFAYARMNVSIN